MAKQWVVNVANGPRMIGGVLLSPGEGTFVDDGPDGAAAPASESTVVALASTRLASMAAAGNAVPSGVLLKDPATGKIFGQSDGLGGYEALGGVGASSGVFRGSYTWAARPLTGLTIGDTIRARLTCKRKVDRNRTDDKGVGQGVVAWENIIHVGHHHVLKKDIEVLTTTYGWMETHSCTYFGEEQTKRFGITGLTHTISNTGVASPRILVPLLERAGIPF